MSHSGYGPVNGITIYYEIHGAGDLPLVLIHGGGSTIESSFSMLLPILAEKHRIITLELQAHGRTSDRAAPESFEQDADDVAGLLHYLQIEKANIFGFSNGGTTTLQIAMRYPDLVNKIMVVSGAYQREGFIAGFFENMPLATIDQMPQALQEAYLKVNPDKKGLQNMFEKDKARMVNFKDIPDENLQSIKVPTLIMSSDMDVVTNFHALKMAGLIPNARLAILPGDHGSILGEVSASGQDETMTRITAALVNNFLRD